ncbi:MAG: hypothetical protein ACFHWX_12075 [Bacteroidota bacterium]
MVIRNGIILSLLFALVIGNTFAAVKGNEIIGTWNYSAPSAPYEYSKGKLIFTAKGDAVEGTIKLGGNSIKMRNLKIEKNEITFGIYLEGEYISITARIDKNAFSGKATYSEGSVDLKGEKE